MQASWPFVASLYSYVLMIATSCSHLTVAIYEKRAMTFLV